MSERHALTGHGAGGPAPVPLHQPDSSTIGEYSAAATSQDGGSKSQDGGSNGHRRDWRLPTTERSVTVLRRGLTDFVREAELSEDDGYDFLLAVCEAASNAIEHAHGPAEPFFDVCSQIDEAGVTVVVRDYGQWSDKPPGCHRGRGLAMMEMLADSTILTGPDGTTVTLRSPRHGGHPVARRGEPGTAGRTPPASSAAGGA